MSMNVSGVNAPVVMNIMGVDPGTNFAGAAIFTIDPITLEIKGITTTLLDVRNIRPSDHIDPINQRLAILTRYIKEIVTIYMPASVTVEHGFMNRLRPGAFGPLSKAIFAIQMAGYDVNPFLKNFLISPTEVKQAVNAKKFKGKDPVLEAAMNIDELSRHIDMTLITEHEVDGIAICYSHLKKLREVGVLGLCLL